MVFYLPTGVKCPRGGLRWEQIFYFNMYRAVEKAIALSAKATTGPSTNINNAVAVNMEVSLRVVIF